MGKFAEELGIDIKQHQDQLPENNKDYKFEQEHKLLESGRVQHIYKIKKDKEKLMTNAEPLNIFSGAQNKYGKCYQYIKETERSSL